MEAHRRRYSNGQIKERHMQQEDLHKDKEEVDTITCLLYTYICGRDTDNGGRRLRRIDAFEM